MADPILPALTKEEWEARAIEQWPPRHLMTEGPMYLRRKTTDFEAKALPSGTLHVMTSNSDVESEEAVLATETLPKLIALANDALPDSSPYKITREDLEWVAWAANYLEIMSRNSDNTQRLSEVFRVSVPKGDRLAAKLSALLPPEG